MSASILEDLYTSMVVGVGNPKSTENLQGASGARSNLRKIAQSQWPSYRSELDVWLR
jgi:hypothetical protein